MPRVGAYKVGAVIDRQARPVDVAKPRQHALRACVLCNVSPVEFGRICSFSPQGPSAHRRCAFPNAQEAWSPYHPQANSSPRRPGLIACGERGFGPLGQARPSRSGRSSMLGRSARQCTDGLTHIVKTMRRASSRAPAPRPRIVQKTWTATFSPARAPGVRIVIPRATERPRPRPGAGVP